MTKKQKKKKMTIQVNGTCICELYMYETTRIGCHRHNMIQFLIAFYFSASNL